MSKRVVIVTGGAGFIGSHCVLELLKNDFDVVVIDNFVNSVEMSIQRVEELANKKVKKLESVSLLEDDAIDKIFARYEGEIQAVIHFAGLKAVGESIKAPLTYYHNNLIGTLVLIEKMAKYHVKNLVFSSSATVYGGVQSCPSSGVSEEHPLFAINPYGRTKLFIEEILRDLFISDSEWNIVSLRYFNPVGADPSGRIGEDPRGVPCNLMPFVTQVAAGRLAELSVFGGDYPTKDGTGVRDYIHVVDLAMGHIAALKFLSQNPGYEAINLGTGRGYSVLEMVTAMQKVSGKEIPYKIVDRRPGDIAEVFASPSKAETLLGWKASRSIEQMCEDCWRWQSQNPNGYMSNQ